MFTPSEFQAKIFSWIQNGRGNAFVAAVAGSGKTTTIVEAAKCLTGGGLFVAFNKDIATELEKRLSGTSMTASTIHSQGYGCLAKLGGRGRMTVDGRKYTAAFTNKCNLRNAKKTGDAYKLIDLVRVNLAHEIVDGRVSVLPKHVEEIVAHHGIDIGPELSVSELAQDLTAILNDGLAQCAAKRIDFTDMIWAPVVLGLTTKTYQWIFVDEAQDLNRCQLSFIQKFRGRGGRMLFVGDPSQAIYGFAGADSESVDRIVATLECEILPLSITYRCPRSHVALINQMYPDIMFNAAPDAIEGSIETLSIGDAIARTGEGDLFLCRVNAPLIKMCFRLIAQGVPARVRGRGLDKELLSIVAKLEIATNKMFGGFADALKGYENEQVSRLAQFNAKPTTVDAFVDKIKCLKIIYINSKATDYASLKAGIKEIFSDERGSVCLSSVHKAKGLEADRVFILNPEKMPHPMAKLVWEQVQEANIQYVAFTRSLQALIFVTGEVDEIDFE